MEGPDSLIFSARCNTDSLHLVLWMAWTLQYLVLLATLALLIFSVVDGPDSFIISAKGNTGSLHLVPWMVVTVLYLVL